jgi:regulatory protein
MTIVSIKTGTGAELRRIELSDGSFFWFKTRYLPPVFIDEGLYTPGAAEGREISADEEAGFRFASACLRAEKAALRLIARAEQCLSGLSRKLQRRGHEPACVRAVIDCLVELELVDDWRFARLWLETRLGRRSASPRRLLAGLCARGIGRDEAETALKTVLDDETEWFLIRRFAVKRRRVRSAQAAVTAGVRAEDARRFLKFTLKSEGFSAAAIERFLDGEQDTETGGNG